MRGSREEPWRLSRSKRRKLERLSRAASAPHRLVMRARIILLSALGWGSAEIARAVGCSSRVVRKWRARFVAGGKDPRSLKDLPRVGRPREVPLEVRCTVMKLACERPEDSQVPFRAVWTLRALREAVARETGRTLSISEIRRVLGDEDLQPHRMRLWLHSQDPEFQAKIKPICALYLEPPPGATVLCIDEKTGIQALRRKNPTRYPRPGRAGRFEFEYKRHGTWALFAAFNVATGHVLGQVSSRRGADELADFMESVAQHYPQGDVYVVWDNLNLHGGPCWPGFQQRWLDFSARHAGRFHFVHTPLHASWMNQVEVWFSILARRALRFSSFSSREELRTRILGFIDHWNRSEAHPFKWKWSGRPRARKQKRFRRRASQDDRWLALVA
jgi:transposase